MTSAHENRIEWQARPVRLISEERIAELKTLLGELRLQIENAPEFQIPTIKVDKKE